MTSSAASADSASGTQPRPVVDQRMEERVAMLTMQAAPHNVLDAALIGALLSGLSWASEQEARAIVVRSGLRHFCAGANVDALRRAAEAGGGVMERAPVDVLRAFAAVPVPVIASVHGVCVGGGLEVALACDLFVAAESAMIGSVEVMVGLHPLMGAIQRITQRAGAARAAEMALLGRRYDARTLERWNIINHVVPDERLAEVTMTLAQELAHGPTVAHAATKQLIAKAVNDGIAAADAAMAGIQQPIFLSEDFPNAARSFLTEGPGRARFEGR